MFYQKWAKGLLLLEDAADFETVHPRHHYIKQDKVRLCTLSQYKGLWTVVRTDNIVVVMQRFVENSEILRNVIDNQQFFLFHSISFRPRCNEPACVPSAVNIKFITDFLDCLQSRHTVKLSDLPNQRIVKSRTHN